MDQKIITVRTIVEQAVEEEFNEWQFEEHVPWILSVDGYTSVRRYKDLEHEHSYMNLWTLEDYSAHDCEDHERKSKSPWGRRLKRYRKLKVDFYHKQCAYGCAPTAGSDCIAALRYEAQKKSDPDLSKKILSVVETLSFVKYAAVYEQDRGGTGYFLRVHFSIPEYATDERWQAAMRAIAAMVTVKSRESYSAMADTVMAN